MPKTRTKRTSGRSETVAFDLAATPMVGSIPTAGGVRGPVETTGRFVVIFKSNGSSNAASVRAALSNVAGLKNVVATSDYESGAVASADVASAGAVHYEKLGVVVIKGDDAVQALAANASDGDSRILAIEPEYLAYPSRTLA